MDVKCEKCGTEYEFDDRKISETGITVKCTNCGHLFKVVRQRVALDERPVIGADDPSRELPGPRRVHWMIRNAHGEVKEFKDLATLQQWIAQGKVSPTDEISKSGETWKPLSTIVELSGMFGAPGNQPARPAAPPPPPTTAEDLMASGQFRLEGPSDPGTPSPRAPHASQPVAQLAPTPGLYATGGYAAMNSQMMPVMQPAHPAPQAMMGQHPGMTGQQPVMHPGMTGQQFIPGMTGQQFIPGMTGQHMMPGFGHSSGAMPRPGEPSSSTFVFEDQGPPGYGRREQGAARGFAMGVLATVALAGAGYFVYDQLADRPAAPPVAAPSAARPAPDVAATLEQARASWARDGLTGFAESRVHARRALTELGGAGSAAQRALAHALEARALVGQAEYARLQRAPFNLGEAEEAVAQAESLAPTLPEVLLARLELDRVAGRIPQARQALARARAAGVDSTALALQEAALDLHAGHDAAATAARLTKLPSEVLDQPRGRYLAAVALHRAGDRPAATMQLQKLLEGQPAHGPAQALMASLGGATVAAAPASAKGTAADGVRPPAAPVVAPPPSAPASAAPATPQSAARAPEPRAEPAEPSGGFDSLMRQGARALERGRTREARRLFEAARNRNARSPEPWANLGWCDLDDRKLEAAIGNFRKALERSPRYADAMFGLGNALEQAGRKAEALQAYRSYLDAHRRGRHASIVKRKLEQLR
ncbi:MAG: zinc-ribbon domain-containing protein [Myxococcales bacterium]|nr:zinc-ribbon domain-containing protein [Myxococcales bacterium]